jgi:DNA repair protein RadC
MFRGTVNSSAVYTREVVKECLWRGAVGVIFAHNHPSGVAQPSNRTS